MLPSCFHILNTDVIPSLHAKDIFQFLLKLMEYSLLFFEYFEVSVIRINNFAISLNFIIGKSYEFFLYRFF